MQGALAGAVRAAVAGGRLRDDRVVPAVEHARAGAVGLAAARAPPVRAARERLGGSACAATVVERGRSPARSGVRSGAWCLSPSICSSRPASSRSPVRAWAARSFPRQARQFQLRFRAPAGHEVRVDRAAGDRRPRRDQAHRGPDNVDITLGYVGVQPSSYPINTIFLWTGGLARGRAAGGAQAGAAIRIAPLEGTAAPALREAISRPRSSRSSRATSSAAS